jgi:hypothetical protein
LRDANRGSTLRRLKDVAEQRPEAAELLHEVLVAREHDAAEDVTLPARNLVAE